jgi:hypothetical protein
MWCFIGTEGISFWKKLWTLLVGSILTVFKEKKLCRLCISFAIFPLLGSTFLKSILNLLAIPFFLSLHTHSYYWSFWSIKIKFFFIFHFLTDFQLTFLRYYQVVEAKKQTHFYWKSKKIKFQPKDGFEKPYFWSLNIMLLQLVKFRNMDFWEDIHQ